jgi:MscS family membrane protein
MRNANEHDLKGYRNREAARAKVAAKVRVWPSMLVLAALLVIASTACTATTATPPPPPAASATPTQPLRAAVASATPSMLEGVSPTLTPTPGIAASVASRTPEPTMAPGPLERAVADLTDRAGVANTSILGLTTDDWINLAISVLMVLLTIAFAAPLLRRVLRRVVKTTSTDLDDRLATAVFPRLWQFVVVIVLDFATMRLDFLGEGLRTFLGDVYFLLFVVIVGQALWKILDTAVDWYDKQLAARDKDIADQDKTVTVLAMVRRVGKVAIIFVCASLVLEHLGIRITAVAASFGLIGLAFSLAAQDTLSDFISGFLIMVDQPFRVGDRIEIEEINTWGDVVDIGARTTRIRTRDNRMVIVPNSTIGKNQIINYTYPDPTYRVQIEIGIGYDADIDETRRIIQDAVSQVDGVLQDKPVDALFLEFGDSAMVYRVRWWIHSYADTRRMFDKVNEAMYKALSAAGVDMPFTTYDVNIKLDAGDVERISELSEGRSANVPRAAPATDDSEASQ